MARYLNPEQRRLYELIWKRAVASQMQSAELDQVTVEMADPGKPNGPRLRATGSILAFDGFLKLYREDRDDDPEGAEDEDGRMLPPMAERDPLRRGEVDAEPAFHPAAAALFGGQPGQEDGGAGHRPALHLCLHPVGAAGPQLRAAGASGASCRRIAAGWSRPS